ncbi:MAG: molybdopterin molybdenumtransferase MoeA [Saprospiraceae bacterium]|nr:MAG: molybdopterin molybdenumtransferase MoeA [Saprospiraceae bacterium]
MITVEEAIGIILEHRRDFGTESVALDEAMGRVLRENLYADRDFPPYNRVTMDGIALQYNSFERGQRKFDIEGIAAAGAPQMSLQREHSCLEVMTGSILPKNTDTVIRYEDIVIEEDIATLQIDTLRKGQNVHRQGEDRFNGSRVVKERTRISPAEIGVAATIGKSKLLVSRLPKTIIISTGDELVRVEDTPLPYQIRRSNVHRLQATLLHHGIRADVEHLQDDQDEIKAKLTGILEHYELIILSGGVSKGKFDFLPESLIALGVRKLFHTIKQRPGKPLWFGEAPGGTIVFALPGNPVSSFLGTHRYVIPWLQSSEGIATPVYPRAILNTSFHFQPDLQYFLQVKISYDQEGRVLATPVEGHGSGDLANLVDADAFLELPRDKSEFAKGEAYPVIFFRS